MTSIGANPAAINNTVHRDVARETPTVTPTATSVEQTAAAREAVVEQATDVTATRGENGQGFLDTARAVTAAAPALPASAASTAELYGPTAAAPAEDIGFFGQLKGVATGAWGGVTDLAGGLKDMGVGAVNLTGLNGAEAQAQTQATLSRTADVIVNNPGAVLDAVTKPVTEPWSQGRYGEAIGRGAFEVASLLVGTKGVDKVGKLGTAAHAADTAADAARVADTAADAARVADTAADAARVAKANEVLPVTSASVAAPGMGSTKLHFLASELKAEVMNGISSPIAGAGTNTPLRVADDLAAKYGGTADEWQKVTSTQRGVRMDGTVVPSAGQTTHTAPSAIARPSTVDASTAADNATTVANFEVHAYRNTRTGDVVEPKLIAEIAGAAPKIAEHTGQMTKTPKQRFEIRDLADF